MHSHPPHHHHPSQDTFHFLMLDFKYAYCLLYCKYAFLFPYPLMYYCYFVSDAHNKHQVKSLVCVKNLLGNKVLSSFKRSNQDGPNGFCLKCKGNVCFSLALLYTNDC